MQPKEIDPELNRLALEEATQKFPQFAGLAVSVAARPLFQGYAWLVEWKGTPPQGQDAWEFQTPPFGLINGWRELRD